MHYTMHMDAHCWSTSWWLARSIFTSLTAATTTLCVLKVELVRCHQRAHTCSTDWHMETRSVYTPPLTLITLRFHSHHKHPSYFSFCCTLYIAGHCFLNSYNPLLNYVLLLRLIIICKPVTCLSYSNRCIITMLAYWRAYNCYLQHVHCI